MVAQILQHTPVWVWAVLLALVLLGHAQTKTRRVSRARLFALPLAMLAWSLASLVATFGAADLALAGWLAGALLALALNRFLRIPRAVTYAAAERRYTIPGSPLPMLLMLAIFAVRYAVIAASSVDAALRSTGAFVVAAGLAYGLLSGMLFARARHAARAAKLV